VVDDDPAIREVVADILQTEGYVVDLAKDGQVALERIREHRPDVVLLDLMMPVMNGWQFLKAEDSTAWPSSSCRQPRTPPR
jgi:CheY-like chemotaxis protein